MTDSRSAFVYIQNRKAGIIRETADGYEFTYLKEYLEGENPLPASLTLPLENKTFISPVLFPFFEGLIPEGWLLSVVIRNWKLDAKDRFGILIASCRDAVGDVSIRRTDDAE